MHRTIANVSAALIAALTLAVASPLNAQAPQQPVAPSATAPSPAVHAPDFARVSLAIKNAQGAIELPMSGVGLAFTSFKGEADAPAAARQLEAAFKDAGQQTLEGLWTWIRAAATAKPGEKGPAEELEPRQRGSAFGVIGALAWTESLAPAGDAKVERLAWCTAATQRLLAQEDPGGLWMLAHTGLRLQLATMLKLAAEADLSDADLKRLAACGLSAFDTASHPWERVKVSVGDQVRYRIVWESKYREDAEVNRAAAAYLSAIERVVFTDVSLRRSLLYSAMEKVPQEARTKLTGLAYSDRLLDGPAQNQTLASLLVLTADARIARRATGEWPQRPSTDPGRTALRDYIHGREFRLVTSGDSLVVTSDPAAPAAKGAKSLFFAIVDEFQEKINPAASLSLRVNR